MHIIKKRLQYRYFPVNIAIFPEHFFEMCYLYFINAPFINVLSFIYENVILLFTNILFKMLDINPLYCKKNHVWKYNLISFFWNFIIDFFFISEVLYERNCSTKVAAQPFKAGALQYFTGVCKKYVLQKFLKFTKKQLYWKPVSIKMRYHSQQFLKKETQAQLFFHEFCEIFSELLRVAAFFRSHFSKSIYYWYFSFHFDSKHQLLFK